MKIEESEGADKKTLGDLRGDRAKVEQQDFFRVYDDEVSVSDLKFFADGIELGMMRSATISTGNGSLDLASPEEPRSKGEWDRWWAGRIHLGLRRRLAEFERTCKHNFSSPAKN